MERDISRMLGVAVPTVHPATDPASTSRADTFRARWSDMLGPVWIGGGLTLLWPKADGPLWSGK